VARTEPVTPPPTPSRSTDDGLPSTASSSAVEGRRPVTAQAVDQRPYSPPSTRPKGGSLSPGRGPSEASGGERSIKSNHVHSVKPRVAPLYPAKDAVELEAFHVRPSPILVLALAMIKPADLEYCFEQRVLRQRVRPCYTLHRSKTCERRDCRYSHSQRASSPSAWAVERWGLNVSAASRLAGLTPAEFKALSFIHDYNVSAAR
jgi:hypothetical protein